MSRQSKVFPGMRYGRLVILERAGNYPKGILWSCRCDCGTVKTFRSGNLLTGASSSCGCIRRMAMDARKLIFTMTLPEI